MTVVVLVLRTLQPPTFIVRQLCCNAKLVRSPHPECREVTRGHDEALVILTCYNGIAFDDRYVNAMGFMS